MVAIEIRGVKERETEIKFHVVGPKYHLKAQVSGVSWLSAQGSPTGRFINATFSATTHFSCTGGPVKASEWSEVGMGRPPQ
jgi:hypothetical protein